MYTWMIEKWKYQKLWWSRTKQVINY
jgi:hypothetical protein